MEKRKTSPDDPVFYVYAYMDPRVPGQFEYNSFILSHQPKYIGKGMGRRIYAHMLCLKSQEISHKANWLRELNSLGLSPVVVKLVENIADREAQDLEKMLIAAIGRSDLNAGPLCNHTDGGDGTSGHSHSIESRKKWVETRRAKYGRSYHTPEKAAEQKERMKGSGNPMYGKTHSPERIEALRAQVGPLNPNYGHKWTDEQKKAMSEKLSGENNPNYGKHWSEETKKKQSESKIGEKNPMFGKQHSKETLEKLRKVHKGSNNGMYGRKHSPETIEKLKAKAKERERRRREASAFDELVAR